MRLLLRFGLFVLILCLCRGSVGGIVITEIMYHPASDDDREEYIEIANVGGEEIADLTGYRFTEGILFGFPEGAFLPKGARAIVAADPLHLAAVYGLDPRAIFGPWKGSLSDRGERITLKDQSGMVVDTVTYSDEPPWPKEPDGEGPSLECINPQFPNESARNWAPSRPQWFHVQYSGIATSSKLIFYLAGAGSCLIDDITLTPISGGDNRIRNGGFSGGIEPWTCLLYTSPSPRD
mgnify:CR=1 FL=1